MDKLQLSVSTIFLPGEGGRLPVGPVKAIRALPASASDPRLIIGDRTIVFPVRMESGMVIKFRPAADC